MDTPIRALLVAKTASDVEAMRAALTRGGLAIRYQWIATETQCRAALADGTWDLICCSFLSLPLPSATKAFSEMSHPPPLWAFADELNDDVVRHAYEMGALIWRGNALPYQLGRVIEKAQGKRRTMRRQYRCRAPHYLTHSSRILERRTAIAPLRAHEEALRRSKAELHAIFAHTSQGLILFEADQRIVKCNSAFERILGYSATQLLRMRLDELIHQEDLPVALAAFESLVSERSTSFQLELRLVNRSGSSVWSRFIGSAVPSSEDKSHSVIGIFEEITERLRLEEAVRSSETKNTLIVDSIVETVYFIGFSASGDYIVQSINDAYIKLTGFTREQLIGNAVQSFIPEPTLSELLANFDLAIAEHRTVRWNTVVEYPSGTAYVETTATPLFDAQNCCTGLVGIVYDMTARVLAERKVVEQAALLDHAHDAIFLCDLQGNVQYWNEGASRLYGWTREEVLGRNVGEFIQQKVLPVVEEATKYGCEKESWSCEQFQRAKGGKELTIDSSMTLMRNAQGEPQHVLGINIDVTDRKKLELRIALAQRMESLSAVARSVAHDFNNILTTIIGNVGLVRRLLPFDHPAQKKLTTIQDASARAVDLARQIQTFSRHDNPKRARIKVGPVVEQALRLLRATLPPTIEVRAHFSPESHDVLASATQIHQIVIDFGLKAAHAMNKRKGVLNISLEFMSLSTVIIGVTGQIAPGHYMRLSASDNGEGMDEVALANFLAPLASLQSPQETGAMDITAILAIVNHHQGGLAVASKPGQGTTFSFYFPLARSVEPREKPPSRDILPSPEESRFDANEVDGKSGDRSAHYSVATDPLLSGST